MEEVWVVYLCLFLVVVVYFLMKQKPGDEIRSEQQPGDSSAPSSYCPGSVGRHLECSEEELQQSLERLVGILSSAEARKTDARREQSASLQHRPSHPELSQSDIQEKASHPGSHESLVDEIEQAVQETVDSNVYARRQQAPRSRREVERSELSEHF